MNEPHLPAGALVDATPHPCPYLPDRTAVLPLRWYYDDIEPAAFDHLLARSDRRVGRSLYRPSCPSCDACEGIRLPVNELEPSRSQRRVLRRNPDVRVTAGPPQIDRRRLDLFNRHKLERELSDEPMGSGEYRRWLTETCVPTLETAYWVGDRLIGVGILDVGVTSASSAYFYFDPDESRRSLGVFSVLAEVAWLRARGMQWYYLGLWVRGCDRMAYKSRFLPHERLVDGAWVRFEDPEDAPGARGGAPDR